MRSGTGRDAGGLGALVIGDLVVKKTFLTMTLAALASAGMLASASPAQAQPVPDAPPAPPAPPAAPAPAAPPAAAQPAPAQPAPAAPPAAAPTQPAPAAQPAPAQPVPAAPAAPPPAQPAQPPPPAAEFGVAPAALPSTPVGSTAPVPSVSWGGTPGADSTTPAPEEEEKKQSPFYFTRFTWGNTASTTLFGVGQDIQGHDGDTYDMSFNLNLRYYFVNRPLDKAYVNLNGGVNVEVTDTTQTSTTLKHQPLFQDLILNVGYGHTVYKSLDSQWKTTPVVSVGYTFPTSIVSQEVGKYGSLGVNAALVQQLPLSGKRPRLVLRPARVRHGGVVPHLLSLHHFVQQQQHPRPVPEAGRDPGPAFRDQRRYAARLRHPR